MDITITINAPELAKAINNLGLAVCALSAKNEGATVETAATTEATSAAPPTPTPAPQATSVQTHQPAPAPVPTAAQTYSMEQLAVAATQLVDAGRRAELVTLLSSFGVQALTALPKEQYGAFATQLRSMGAKI